MISFDVPHPDDHAEWDLYYSAGNEKIMKFLVSFAPVYNLT